MSQKKFQVFVSSTFQDLKEERREALNALLAKGCIISGMEIFPAIDQEQFEYIKRQIDSCDYYLLIVGGRYGSLAEDGISYTEKEYDYAVSKGIKVIALIHEDINILPKEKCESDATKIKKLISFIGKVKTGRLVNFWKNTSEINGMVILGITSAIDHFPAVGWVRGNKVTSEELLMEVNELRKEKENLIIENNKLKENLVPKIEDLASLDDQFEIKFYYAFVGQDTQYDQEAMSWKEIFCKLAGQLKTYDTESEIKKKFNKIFRSMLCPDCYVFGICEDIFNIIIIQFKALNLIFEEEKPSSGGKTVLFYKLTELGDRLFMESLAVRKE